MYENYEKYDMLKCYWESHEDAQAASNLYFDRYPERRHPSRDLFSCLQRNLPTYGAFKKPRPRTYQARNRDRELEEITVLGEIQNRTNLSLRKMQLNTGIPKTTALRILKNNKFKPYRVRKIHKLQPNDPQFRLDFCQWYLRKYAENPNLAQNIIWTDEACISSAGIFNRYNSYNWTLENPHITVEIQNQGRYSFNVWVGIFRGRFIGPYIFEGSLTAARYLEILQEFVEPVIDDLPLTEIENVYFQQDGAPCHNAQIIRTFLNQQFGDTWLGNRGPVHWPARSPDLTPLDFYLWGRIKDLTYKRNPDSRDALEAAVRYAFDFIPAVELINAVNHVKKRSQICINLNGVQFEHLL